MSRQILLCVETNKQARTDYRYIDATIKRFYVNDKKIVYRPIFLETKTKYNAKDKVREINAAIERYPGETSVIYFIDYDDCDRSSETQKLFEKIQDFCRANKYEFVFFVKDVEDVYLGQSVPTDQKVQKAEEFSRKKLIETVDESKLRSNIHRKHTSNILTVLDLFWTKKESDKTVNDSKMYKTKIRKGDHYA